MQDKPTIAFVGTTMGEFDAVLTVDDIRRMDQYGPLIAEFLDRLRPAAQVFDLGVVGSDAEASAKRGEIARSGCDLLLVWPLNYTLDTVALHLTQGLGMPLVLLNSTPQPTFPPQFDFAVIMENSTVACIPTITNVLLKNHVEFTLLSGSLADCALIEEIAGLARAAAVGRSLRQSRIGVVGHSYPGISALSIDQASVTGQFGVQLVQIGVEEIAREYRAVSDEEVERLADELCASYVVSDLTPEEICHSVRFEPAMRRLASKYRLNAIASLCQELIANPEIGLAPCHAHTVLAGLGIPVTCECDIATAVAMLILQRFTDEVVFLEYYTQDLARGLAMASHCGQGNLRLAAGPVRVRPHPCYPARRGRGIAYEYVTRAGDATMACLTSINGRWRMIAAPIECLPHDRLPSSTVQLYFRFKNAEFNAAYRRWCELGGIHHFGVAFGDHYVGLEAACRYLGIEFRGVE